LPLPSYEEQQAIANFLDRETARIDDLIKKQERLIELLDEKRVSLINQAVTKGLDPNIPMKDSGIEWLGEVPSHWEIKKIKQVSRLISKGSTPTTIGEGFSAEGVKFIKAENISKGRVSSQPEFYISDETNQMMKRSILLDGDVLVVIAGATIGKAATVLIDDLPANTNQAVSFIRPIDKTISKFLNYWITSDSIKVQILLSAVQSAQPNLSMESLGNLNLVQPPEDEVLRITDFLDFETAKLDQLKQKASKCIELLKEYKTSLISSAVTGKIDVRNYKSSDPINN
jgi:type I restriction enzyme S subunit